MTFDEYAHAVPTLQKESAEKMDALLNGHRGHVSGERGRWKVPKTLILLGRAVAKPGYRACLGAMGSA